MSEGDISKKDLKEKGMVTTLKLKRRKEKGPKGDNRKNSS